MGSPTPGSTTARRRYFEKVVSEELLPVIPLPGHTLVKSEPVALDKDEADIFTRLIPIEIHLQASEYSEAKDRLLRTIESDVANKNVELDKVRCDPFNYASSFGSFR